MKKNIQDILTEALRTAVETLYADRIHAREVPVEFSLAGGFGDLSNNTALRLSGLLKEAPLSVATRIAQEINANPGDQLKECLKEAKAEGAGFINFYLRNEYFYERLNDILSPAKTFAGSTQGEGSAVLIEFVSANPTGPLSVAHARQAVVGDVLANILARLGNSVAREYYLNDEGNQITILGESVQARLEELDGKTAEFPENYYQGEYIYDIARQAKKEKIKSEEMGDFAARVILEVIRKELDDFGVRFDCWYSQKELRESGKIQEALDALKEKGFLYEQDGALWFKSTSFGDDKDRVVIKSDGTYTYLAPDIAYHREKYNRNFKWLINLWGPDHHGYIARLKAAVQAQGKDPESLSVIIVQLASIFKEGKPLEMSTRKGQYITLREVLDEIGTDAARFFFLMRRTQSHLAFDLETAKKQTSENPVYYVQYAYARMRSILRNRTAPHLAREKASLELLKEPEEMALVKKLWQFDFMLQVCFKTLDPYMLTVYLQETAEKFHKFYDRHRVLGQDEGLTNARLSLVEATQVVLAAGLDLLGISKPEEM